VTGPTVLILGGTAEARELAGRLASRKSTKSMNVVSSLAGRVRNPALPAGQVRVGGFGGAAGLADWLTAQEAAAVIDATHPGTPLVSLVRPPWTAAEGDIWHEAGSVEDAAGLLPGLGRRAFLTTGRQELAPFVPLEGMWFLIRCVDPPRRPLPPASEVILARGPYDAGGEAALMRAHEIDVLVTKNSGGELTAGKLRAARELRVPVVMVTRPPLPPDVRRLASAGDAESWLLRQLARNGGG
jgi:precorrin-6A/cobalt-precorrin-6A reductase